MKEVLSQLTRTYYEPIPKERVLGDASFKKASVEIGDSFHDMGGYQQAVYEIFTYKKSLGIMGYPIPPTTTWSNFNFNDRELSFHTLALLL